MGTRDTHWLEDKAELTPSSDQALSQSDDVPTLDTKSSRWKLGPGLDLDSQYINIKHVLIKVLQIRKTWGIILRSFIAQM